MNTDNDDLHLALSEAATSTPNPTQQTKRKSKFFFTSAKSIFNQEMETRADQFKPKVLEHIDELVVNRSNEYLKELPKSLEDNISNIREFFLKELSPLTLALNAGANQASAVVNMAVGVNIEPSVIAMFERMYAKGINIKMSNYIAEYLSLPKSDALILLQSIAPVQKAATFLGPDLLASIKPERLEGI